MASKYLNKLPKVLRKAWLKAADYSICSICLPACGHKWHPYYLQVVLLSPLRLLSSLTFLYCPLSFFSLTWYWSDDRSNRLAAGCCDISWDFPGSHSLWLHPAHSESDFTNDSQESLHLYSRPGLAVAEPLSRGQQGEQWGCEGSHILFLLGGMQRLGAMSWMGGREVAMIFSADLTTLLTLLHSEALQPPHYTEMHLVRMLSGASVECSEWHMLCYNMRICLLLLPVYAILCWHFKGRNQGGVLYLL